ncbi:MAG: hypothetical protein KDA42_07470 [Planctomycetales bacterium]|nr:hypothetical protein [Planctomycetales bacterium]
METSLHRQLKSHYAASDEQTEVQVDSYRIDAVDGDELIEIQHASLAALRSKTAKLLKSHRVRIVKPIIATKYLVKLDGKGGNIVSRRRSPKRGSLLDLFDELIYFREIFPHRRLTIEAVLVDVEERRYPGHGRRRRWRRRDHEVEDQRLLEVHGKKRLRTARDLRALLGVRLPKPFHTGHLAKQLGVERWFAQRIAYCLRHAGTVDEVGKQGNTRLYQFARRSAAA